MDEKRCERCGTPTWPAAPTCPRCGAALATTSRRRSTKDYWLDDALSTSALVLPGLACLAGIAVVLIVGLEALVVVPLVLLAILITKELLP